MTIEDNGTKNQYTATSSQTTFPYTFEIFDSGDIAVLQNGVELTITTDYIVHGVGDESGGNVILTTGATTGDILTLYRDMALERLTDYQNNGDFLSDDVNTDFDRVWAALQQNKNTLTSAIRPAVTDTVLDSSNTELAAPSVRADKVLAFDSTGELEYLSLAFAAGDYVIYNNVSTMTVDTSLTAGDWVGTQGYNTSGDGGKAIYKIKTVAQAATDGDVIDEYGNHSISGGLYIAILQITGETIYLPQYGVLSTNDAATNTLAIHAAYAHASNQTTQVTLLSAAGTFLHTGIITKPDVILEGAGHHEGFGTTFYLADNSNTDSFATQTVTFTQFEGFKNLRIDGNKDNQSSGHGLNAYYWDIANVLHNVAFSDCKEGGLRFENTGTQTGNVYVSDCIFNRNDGGAVIVDGPVDCLTFNNSAFEGNGGAAGSNIVLNDLNDASSVNLVNCRGELRTTVLGGGARHVVLNDCNGALLNITGGNYSLGANFAEMFKISTSTARVNISGLKWPTAGWPANPADIIINDTIKGDDLTYTDLTSKGKNVLWNMEQFIAASVTGSVPVLTKYLDGSGKILTFTGNGSSPEGVVSANVGSLHMRSSGGTAACFYQKVSGSSNTGWLPVGRDATITTFTDGDATPSVAGKTMFKTSNTSATTITNFDNGISGQEIWVEIGDANTTIDFTGNAKLKGNAGVDLVGSQFDSLRCVWDGGRWLCQVGLS